MLNFDIKTPQQLKELAKKSIWGASLSTLFLTPVGYLYTGRKKLALIALVIWLPLLLLSEESDALNSLLGFFILGATIENILAIQRAREAVKKNDFNLDKDSEVSKLSIALLKLAQAKFRYVQGLVQGQQLSITLLKLAQVKGEITMADCVIKTGKKPEELLKTLIELERHDMLRSGNRESDGAVVYRIV
jgi:hypothetical protein